MEEPSLPIQLWRNVTRNVTNESIYVNGNSRRTPGDESVTRFYVSTVYALSASTGQIKWEVEQNLTREAMVLDEPYLYALGEKYLGDQQNTSIVQINAYDTRTGEKVWNYTIDGGYIRTGLQFSNGTGRKMIYCAGVGYFVYGFSSSSTEPVPELPNTSLILTVSLLVLIPLLFRKRRRCEYA